MAYICPAGWNLPAGPFLLRVLRCCLNTWTAVDNLTIVGSKIEDPKPQRTYTVKRGDTLWGIAKKELGSGARYTEIVHLNGLKTNVIYSGQKLKLPEK